MNWICYTDRFRNIARTSLVLLWLLGEREALSIRFTIRVEYLLADKYKYKKPTHVPAKTYIDYQMKWMESRLENKQLFPLGKSTVCISSVNSRRPFFQFICGWIEAFFQALLPCLRSYILQSYSNSSREKSGWDVLWQPYVLPFLYWYVLVGSFFWIASHFSFSKISCSRSKKCVSSFCLCFYFKYLSSIHF